MSGRVGPQGAKGIGSTKWFCCSFLGLHLLWSIKLPEPEVKQLKDYHIMVANHSYINVINKCYLTAAFIMNILYNHIIACLGFHLCPCCFNNMTQQRIIRSLFSSFFVDACSVMQGKDSSEIAQTLPLYVDLKAKSLVIFASSIAHWWETVVLTVWPWSHSLELCYQLCELSGLKWPKSFSPSFFTDTHSSISKSKSNMNTE